MLKTTGGNILCRQPSFQFTTIVKVSLNKKNLVIGSRRYCFQRRKPNGLKVCVQARLANVLHDAVDDIDTSLYEAIGKFADAERQSATKRQVNLETDRCE